MPVVFSVHLQDDGSPSYKKQYVRLPPPLASNPYLLRFVIPAGSTAAVKDCTLVTNYPKEGSAFQRETYQRLRFDCDDLADAVCEFQIKLPGVFEYHVEYTPLPTAHTSNGTSKHSNLVKSAKIGAVVVDPRLMVTNQAILDPATSDDVTSEPPQVLLPLDGICILTVIPKWMPQVTRWNDHFRAFAESGYNMVHLAPVNTRGASNSPYSIYDQLSISPDLFDKGVREPERERILKETLEFARKEFGILTVTDVVWNHTAHNSVWLQYHPEAGYNLKTAPHLRPAYELDEAILQLSEDLASYGINPAIQSHADLSPVMEVFNNKILPSLKLWEFYVVDVAKAESSFRRAWVNSPSTASEKSTRFSGVSGMDPHDRMVLLRKHAIYSIDEEAPPGDDEGFALPPEKYIHRGDAVCFGRRFGRKLDPFVGVEFVKEFLGNSAANIEEAVKVYLALVSDINLEYYRVADNDLKTIQENVCNRAKYMRVDLHGPRLGPVTRNDPFVDTYFTRLPRNVITKDFHDDELSLANNGWIWNADPLVNFAGPESSAYLRREVIPWGDCVKLRYGEKPEDCPWLWQHQVAYTEKMATLFHGFRIDNCHSTPINVASYLLDVARRINPDLYVFAELFTGSEEKDIAFVKKLGINSLIREAMNAWDPPEMSRLVHRHGGVPVGSLTFPPEYFPLDILGHQLDSTFYEPCGPELMVVNVCGSTPHALFMDCTHDNETPHQKRTAEDTLPTAALVAMTNCAVGSVRGFDEIVPYGLNVVTETRKYRIPENYEGIIPAKSILLNLHTKMAREGFIEIHVHQEHDVGKYPDASPNRKLFQFISIHRVHPVTHDGYLLIARCAFSKHVGSEVHSPIVLINQAVHVIESAGLRVQAPMTHEDSYLHPPEAGPDGEDGLAISPNIVPLSMLVSPHDAEAIAKSRDARSQLRGRKTLGAIAGLPSFLDFSAVLTTLAKAEQIMKRGPNNSEMIETVITIDPKHFLPGSVVVYRTWMVASGMELDTPVQYPPVHPPSPSPQLASMLGSPYGRLHLEIPTSPIIRATSPDFRPKLVKKLTPAIPLIASTDVNGSTVVFEGEEKFERLWRFLGLDNKNRGIQIMVQMGMELVEASQLQMTALMDSWPPGLWDAVKNLESEEINAVLYRAAPEEYDFIGENAYDVPGSGPLAYCGLQGFISAIASICRHNDLGHPMCSNLRAGTWMLDYVFVRLERYARSLPGLQPLARWLLERFNIMKELHASFIPKYFFQTMFVVYHAIRYKCLKNSVLLTKLSSKDPLRRHVSSIETFTQSLLMTKFQLNGIVKSTGLLPPNISIPGLKPSIKLPSLAAGLPHFSTRHMRCWGRDIFISLRGLLLLTGDFESAKAHIIAFGSTLKHGLIPNLLDQGVFPRYNARDATWWWLHGVKNYCQMSPEGLSFLSTKVPRRFPPKKRYRHDVQGGQDTYLRVSVDDGEGDDYVSPSDPHAFKFTSTIGELCHEIMERHAHGIQFREWNAGHNLDHAMSDAGFNVSSWCALSNRTNHLPRASLKGTGIIGGGNRHNCGTWMDKMGDSEKAGTRGVPATPRDGASVEIVGLLKSALQWVVNSVLPSSTGKSSWPSEEVVVKDDSGKDVRVSYKEWNDSLHASFEKCFFIPLDPKDDVNYDLGHANLINRRGIYKDTVGSSVEYTEFQLRPNFCVALAVAPELFNPNHARIALDVVKNTLVGPLGMKTLDPTDWAYRGVYDNSNDSTDESVAHGFNYHQGPEWVWVVGFFLQAYYHFNVTEPKASKEKRFEVIYWIQRLLLKHKSLLADLEKNPFAGLPELTNANGAFCHGSCPTQAWSSAVMIEAINSLLQ